jgi:hypothetical protein
MGGAMTIASSTEQDIAVYRPTWWAIYLYYSAMGILGFLLVAFVEISIDFLRGIGPDINHWLTIGPSYIGGWLTGAVLASFLLYDHLHIRVTNFAILGPAPFGFFRRNTFLLTRIDKPRTIKRSFWQKLFGYRNIWSVDGQRVVVNLWLLKKGQVVELFEKVGCGDRA